MKTVIVCNTDINELIYLINCKLGELGTSLLYSKKYGILGCDEIKMTFSELYNYKELFNDILKNRNSNDIIIDSIGLPMICNICETSIEKIIERVKDILRECVNCAGNIRELIKVEESSFADDWYNSQEYIECLQFELEDNGWIDPLVDLCQNLNIVISVEKLCKDIAIELATSKKECMTLSEIDVQSAFNNMLVSRLCTINITGLTFDGSTTNIGYTTDATNVNLVLSEDLNTLVLDCKSNTGTYTETAYGTFIAADNVIATLNASKDGCINNCGKATFITINQIENIPIEGDTIQILPSEELPVCTGTISYVYLYGLSLPGMTFNTETGIFSIPAQYIDKPLDVYYYMTCNGLVVATVRLTLSNALSSCNINITGLTVDITDPELPVLYILYSVTEAESVGLYVVYQNQQYYSPLCQNGGLPFLASANPGNLEIISVPDTMTTLFASNDDCDTACASASFITLADSAVVPNRVGTQRIPPDTIPDCDGTIEYIELYVENLTEVTINPLTGVVTILAQVIDGQGFFIYYVTCNGSVTAVVILTAENS